MTRTKKKKEWDLPRNGQREGCRETWKGKSQREESDPECRRLIKNQRVLKSVKRG